MNITELQEHWERFASLGTVIEEVMKDRGNVEKLMLLSACAKDEAEHIARMQ